MIGIRISACGMVAVSDRAGLRPIVLRLGFLRLIVVIGLISRIDPRVLLLHKLATYKRRRLMQTDEAAAQDDVDS